MNNLIKTAAALLLASAAPCLAQRPLHVSRPYHPPEVRKPQAQTPRTAPNVQVAKNRAPARKSVVGR